jgi:hypothetical protein
VLVVEQGAGAAVLVAGVIVAVVLRGLLADGVDGILGAIVRRFSRRGREMHRRDVDRRRRIAAKRRR